MFEDKKTIRLGIWGLGRGMSFYNACKSLNIEVVAGCDYNEHMRNNFLEKNADAFVTDDAEAFLAYDMDAILLATFATEHADDAIRCLNAGKHVLSEVTAFHTMAEAVRLVEAVEATGLTYQLAENYPYTKDNFFLKDQYRKGLFGELQYAEFEYVHNCMSLSYTYIDGVPIMPGNTVHFWRSWINFHYYNTHSLGPIMEITGLRPTRVVALPCTTGIPGMLDREYQGVAASLTTMSNGGVFRNFMGATTCDVHSKRLFGTHGYAEAVHDGLQLKLGGGYGQSKKMRVESEWPEGYAELAEASGHGGGDFWVLYYFTQEIRDGIPGPFNIYNAIDCTATGLLAYRSSVENGKPYDIPDFRNKDERNPWRDDHFAQTRYDVKAGCFPEDADSEITGQFSSTISKLIGFTHTHRCIQDWTTLSDQLNDENLATLQEVKDYFAAELTDAQAVYAKAREIVNAYPDSDGARVLLELLEYGNETAVMAM